MTAGAGNSVEKRPGALRRPAFLCGSVVGSSLLLDRVGILFFNGVGEEKGSLGTSRANHFIQHTGREDDGGEHKAGLGGEEPLPQHRKPMETPAWGISAKPR